MCHVRNTRDPSEIFFILILIKKKKKKKKEKKLNHSSQNINTLLDVPFV